MTDNEHKTITLKLTQEAEEQIMNAIMACTRLIMGKDDND